MNFHCFSSGSFSADSTFSSFLSHRNICFSICEWRRRSDPHCITKAPRDVEKAVRRPHGRTDGRRPLFGLRGREGCGLPKRKWPHRQTYFLLLLLAVAVAPRGQCSAVPLLYFLRCGTNDTACACHDAPPLALSCVIMTRGGGGRRFSWPRSRSAAEIDV